MSNIGYHAHMELPRARTERRAGDRRARRPRRRRPAPDRADPRRGRRTVCGTFELGVSKATRSHHFKVLREAGLTRTRVAGTSRHVRLRRDEIDRHYPGLLDAVLPDREPTNRAG